VEAFLISAGVVAFAEIGDKTQLLAILLAARFRAPLPIILGILGATALNHTLAAVLGLYIGDWLGENLRWILAVSFLRSDGQFCHPWRSDVFGTDSRNMGMAPCVLLAGTAL